MVNSSILQLLTVLSNCFAKSSASRSEKKSSFTVHTPGVHYRSLVTKARNQSYLHNKATVASHIVVKTALNPCGLPSQLITAVWL